MKRLLGYGSMLWVTVFAVGSALYPWSVSARPLFDWAVIVTLSAATALASVLYLRHFREHVLRHALVAASIWPFLCVALDLLMLMLVPPRLGVREYLNELGPVYLFVPAILIAIGLQRHQLEARDADGARHV